MTSHPTYRILTFVEEIYEDLELWYPKLRLQEAGAEVVLAGPEAKTRYAGKHSYPCESDVAIASVKSAGFAGREGWWHVSHVVPARYFIVALRAVVLKGAGLMAFWPDLAALAVFALVMLGLASARLAKSPCHAAHATLSVPPARPT